MSLHCHWTKLIGPFDRTTLPNISSGTRDYQTLLTLWLWHTDENRQRKGHFCFYRFVMAF